MKRAANSIRNQRLSTSKQRKRQHLLDVKVRSHKFRQQRNRKVWLVLCKIILLAGVAGGIYQGGRFCSNKFLWQNPDYNLAAVEIHDDGTLSREQILAVSGIREGENIFKVDLSKARDDLSRLSQVERAELERMLPNKIAITIDERKPVAWVAAKGTEFPTASDGAFLIDGKGILIKSEKQLSEYFHLPVICGYSTENLEAGQMVNAVEMKSALELLQWDADSTRFQIRSIDLSKGYCMVVTSQSHTQITFGLDRVAAQMERLGLLLDHVEAKNKIIRAANLMVERNVPVTFFQPTDDLAADEPPASPAPEKPKPSAPAVVKKSVPAKKTEPVKRHSKPKATPMPVKRALPVTPQYGNG